MKKDLKKYGFFRTLLKAIQWLIIKSISSRKSLFHWITVIVCIKMIFMLENQLHGIIVLVILVVANLTYAGVILWEKIKVSINR